MEFGPQNYGRLLEIKEPDDVVLDQDVYAVDIETDEQDGFVGIGVCGATGPVLYVASLSNRFCDQLGRIKLVGHNIKADLHFARHAGIPFNEDSVVWDTSVAEHVVDSTKMSFGLKALANEHLGYDWPAYDAMVRPNGPRSPKVTLDLQPIPKVAAYCGMDALATWDLYQWQLRNMASKQIAYLYEYELPLLPVLYRMEKKGLCIDVPYLQEMDGVFASEVASIEAQMPMVDVIKAGSKCDKPDCPQPHKALGKLRQRKHYKVVNQKLNPNSPAQLLKYLQSIGVSVTSTEADELQKHICHSFVETILKFREVDKLRGTYTQGLLERPTMPYVHTTLNQTGTVTGRLSSSDPNLQNIPVRTEKGALLRRAFIAG